MYMNILLILIISCKIIDVDPKSSVYPMTSSLHIYLYICMYVHIIIGFTIITRIWYQESWLCSAHSIYLSILFQTNHLFLFYFQNKTKQMERSFRWNREALQPRIDRNLSQVSAARCAKAQMELQCNSNNSSNNNKIANWAQSRYYLI